MFRNRRRTRSARVVVAGAAALLAVGIAACSSSSGSSGTGSASSQPTGAAVSGGAVTEALPPSTTLNYIWPFVPLANASEYNSEGFQQLMYRPLYEFGNNGSSVDVNYPLSPAKAPVYSNGGKTVTIAMKGWKWSDGESVDAQDVVFWLNMMNAEPTNFYGTAPGLLPYNLKSYKATNADTLVLQLKSPVSTLWFTYNQLAEITPMPEAWDVTSAGAKAGSGGCATDSASDKWAKCAAVYKFMSGQAQQAKSYATSPIWGVVDGPWKLSSYSTASSGPVTSFVPNTAYTGGPQPKISKFTWVAYTSDSTEYTALKTGQLDVGYIPFQDLPPVPVGQSLPTTDPLGSGFNLTAGYQFSIEYSMLNFKNPTLGPAFKQLYVRQALQESIDQIGQIKADQRGYGYPDAAGVPVEPKSQWVPTVASQNNGQGPYAFSTANAKKLLTSHGWTEQGGVMTCTSAGTGTSQCGAGVASGTKLSITMDYSIGNAYTQQEVAVEKSDMQEAGIQLNLVSQSFNTVIGEAVPTNKSWQLAYYGGWNFNGPGYEPTGEPLFQTGASSNGGSYSDAQMDNLINLTHTSSSPQTFQQYATYTAEQLPYLWQPNYYNVYASNSKLANFGFSPFFTTLPEAWNFTK